MLPVTALQADHSHKNVFALTGTHFTPGWREAMDKCLAQGHKCPDRDLNPHSNEPPELELHALIRSATTPPSN